MTLISSVEKRARQALGELRQQAADRGWDAARVEQEKDRFLLGHEVTLCSAEGCLELLFALPGYDGLAYTCPAHTAADEG